MLNLATADLGSANGRRRQLREVLSDPHTTHVLHKRLRVGAGWRCLEVGGGYGSVVEWLSRRVGELGHVTVTDVGEDYLSVLRHNAASNVTVLRHDAERDDFGRELYDLVHVRFVLTHLPTRDDVVTKLAASLKPGGWLVIEDADFAGVQGSAGYRAAMAEYAREHALRGSEFAWTRSLPAHFARLGMTEIGGYGSVALFGSNSEWAEFWSSNLLNCAQGVAPASSPAIAALKAGAEELRTGSGWFGGPTVMAVVGRR